MTQKERRPVALGARASQLPGQGQRGNFPSSRKKSTFCRATHRIREVGRLVDRRYPDGIPECPDDADNNYVFVVAQNCFAAANGDEGQAIYSLIKWIGIRAVWVKNPSELATTIIKKLHPRARMMSDGKAGEMLKLRLAERHELKITTMSPHDCTKDEFNAYRKAQKRLKDRQRAAFKRQRAGATPAAKIQEGSLSKSKPWLALGISRRTWFYRRKKEAKKLTETRNGTNTSHGLQQAESSDCTTASRVSNITYNTQYLNIKIQHGCDALVQSQPGASASPNDTALK